MYHCRFISIFLFITCLFVCRYTKWTFFQCIFRRNHQRGNNSFNGDEEGREKNWIFILLDLHSLSIHLKRWNHFELNYTSHLFIHSLSPCFPTDWLSLPFCLFKKVLNHLPLTLFMSRNSWKSISYSQIPSSEIPESIVHWTKWKGSLLPVLKQIKGIGHDFLHFFFCLLSPY